MYVLIGEHDEKMRKLIASLNDATLMIDKPCELANVPKGSVVLIPFANVLANGVIEGANMFIEEVLISPKVKKIVFGKTENQAMLKDLCEAYHIECEFSPFERKHKR